MKKFFLFGGLLFAVLLSVSLGLTVYGLMLAFSASVLVGVVAALLEPLPVFIALIYLTTGFDVAQKAAELLAQVLGR